MEEDKKNENSSEKKKTTSEVFLTERKLWYNIVKEMGTRFKKIEDLALVQIDLYSRRQEAVEYMFRLISIHSLLKRKYTKEWQAAYDRVGQNEDLRYNDKEKTKGANTATMEIKFKMEVVQTHIDFFRETMKSIDSMIFGVKHRIEIENFKIGMK